MEVENVHDYWNKQQYTGFGIKAQTNKMILHSDDASIHFGKDGQVQAG